MRSFVNYFGLIFIFVLLFSTFSAIRAEQQFEPLEVTSSVAYYSVKFQGINVGYSAIAHNNSKGSALKSYFLLRIASRIGTTPIYSRLYSEYNGETNNISVLNKSDTYKNNIINSAETLAVANGKISDNSQKATKSILGIIFPDFPLDTTNSSNWNDKTFPIPLKGYNESNDASYFNPLTKTSLPFKKYNLIFTDDPLPQSFTISLNNGALFDFTKVPKDNAKQIYDAILTQQIDLNWFSETSQLDGNWKYFLDELSECNSFISSLEKEIKRSSPGIPYLLHRKIINLSSLCSDLSIKLSSSETTYENKFKIVATSFKKMEKEARNELPVAFISSPDWITFSNGGLSGQYTKLATFLIRKAKEEVNNLFSIEESRKNDINLQINTKSQEQRAVLNASIKLKSFSIPTTIETPRKDPGYVLNSAIEYAKNDLDEDALSAQCRKQNGVIALDFTSTDFSIITGKFARGIFDTSLKEQILVDLLHKTYSLSECNNIKIIVNSNETKIFSNLVNNIQKSVLELENKIQISNGKNLRIRLFPGTYELTLRSYVNGSLIGKTDFTVTEKKSPLLKINI